MLGASGQQTSWAVWRSFKETEKVTSLVSVGVRQSSYLKNTPQSCTHLLISKGRM